MVQNTLLFVGGPAQDRLAAPAPRQRVAVGVIGAALLLPILEPLGLFDAWPSWAVYAPVQSASWCSYIGERWIGWASSASLSKPTPTTPGSACGWIAGRSQALGVPANPQSRFQLGVAEAVGRAGQLNHWIRAVEFGRAGRWTGRREQRSFSGLGEIRAQPLTFG